MAKSKGNKGKFEFSKVGSIIDGITDKTSIMVEDELSAKREFVGTGIYILNALLSKSILKGGITNNRITAIAGESGVGKSFVAYNICREAQKDGYSIIYIDTEFSIEVADLVDYGIDTHPDRFKLLRSNKVEELRAFMAKFLDDLKSVKNDGYELPKILVVIDSVGQLASKKEVEDAIDGKDKADMTRAKAIKSFMRIINNDLGLLKIPLLATNHTYMSMDLFPKPIMSGGTGLVYTASTIVYLSKAKLKTGKEDDSSIGQSGIVVTAKSMKNRLAQPKKVKFEIDYAEGCNPFKGLEIFCTAENFEKVGVAQGKMEVDKSTGEMYFKPGGTRWYVRHLDKSFYASQIHNKHVFTQDVLEALDPIIYDYFSYSGKDILGDDGDEFVDENTFLNAQEEYDYKEADEIDEIDAGLFD